MAIIGNGIQFHPLYWVLHDNWRYYYRYPDGRGGYTLDIYDHWGHVHFFMLGYNWGGSSQDAFSGEQTYTFSLEETWGPRSRDRNQQHQYRVIGTPRWYFHLEEVWRRVWIQSWDERVATDNPVLKRGIKYDAGAADKRMGPFREGRDAATGREFAPIWMPRARSLPIDYYLTNSLSQAERTNHLADRAQSLAEGWDNPHGAPAPERAFYDPRMFDLQHDNFLCANCGTAEQHAAKETFSDHLYVFPVIEYQKVRQLNWERLPGYEQQNDIDQDHFGDGWTISVTVPFVNPITRRYHSPFANEPGVVLPAGEYSHHVDTQGEPLVSDDKKMRHPKVTYDDPNDPSSWPPNEPPYFYDSPFKQPPELSEQLVRFHNPWGPASGGRWVQQCLGGLVQARAELVIEHKFGGRRTIWVEPTQYVPQAPFAGTDQAQPE